MKLILGILALIIIGAGAFMLWSPEPSATTNLNTPDSTTTDQSNNSAIADRSVVTPGTYTVDSERSIVNWAGKKPLIDGYVNSGSIAVSEGSIDVGTNSATGAFTIDMDTLSVSDTPTKPGQESTLEGHLKGERWFNVATYPEASFAITDVAPRADSDTTFTYDVTGELTMKGVTDTLTFPATIYQTASGELYATADFEFDRTKWGITSGSGSFFDNLADNVIDDMVALSFTLIAEAQ